MPALLAVALAAALFFAASAVAGTCDSYVLHLAGSGSQTISGNLEDFRAAKQYLSGDYLWARRAGRAYVIGDHALVAQAYAFFAPQRELQPKQREVGAEIEALDKEVDALEDAQDERELTRAEQARLEELHGRQRELSRREQQLDEREEELDRAAEKKLWQLIDQAVRSGAARPVR